MKYLSLCSGIEAATVAWHPLGWEAVAYSEIEKFPSEVLAHHYPSTPNLGDMTKFKEWTNVSDVDILVGGTPCQSFSVAGLRKGLDDPRGNLMLTYLAIADKFKPQWLVWENVPGVLSSNRGKDFGVFLGALGELGYGFAYRVLDAQYFGVAQRRKRVFVVGYLGDWRCAAAVLFERHSLQGHPAPSREKRKAVAASTIPSVAGSLDTECGGGKLTHQSVANGHIVPAKPQWWDGGDLAATITTKSDDQRMPDKANAQLVMQPIAVDIDNTNLTGDVIGNLCAEAQSRTNKGMGVMQPAYGIPGNWIGRKPENGGNATEPMYDVAPCLTKADQHGVAQPIPFDTTQITSPQNGNNPKPGDPCHPLAAGAHPPAIVQPMAVRRLTPVECERLQGFPDSYTDIKSKNKPTPDGPRYKALGNSMAVPVMAWIGQRIEQVEAICKQNK
jgi:DNA (cytosine-5)-methyltransferase 1